MGTSWHLYGNLVGETKRCPAGKKRAHKGVLTSKKYGQYIKCETAKKKPAAAAAAPARKPRVPYSLSQTGGKRCKKGYQRAGPKGSAAHGMCNPKLF